MPCDRTQLAFDAGWHRGNYAEAYENVRFAGDVLNDGDPRYQPPEEYETARNRALVSIWKCGFILGVYASYERYEIPEGSRDGYEWAVDFAAKHRMVY